MSECLASKNIDFLKLLVSYRKNSKKFKNLIKCASTEELDAVSEIVLNVLKGILPYKPPNIKFARHKEYLRFIGNPKKNSARKRKNALVSKGRGVIVPLLSAAIPILIEMFSK